VAHALSRQLGSGLVLRPERDVDQGAGGREVHAVLAVERKPSDRRWIRLCRAVGVMLTWPDAFGELF
jgi:hypothetical protein